MFSWTEYIDASYGITTDQRINAFNLPQAQIKETWRDLVNCDELKLNVHGNCTHTECIGHIGSHTEKISSLRINPLMFALCVDGNSDLEEWRQYSKFSEIEAIVVKFNLQPCNWTGKEYPQIIIRDEFPKHLLTDLPSLDKEKGDVVNHKLFFKDRPQGTVTELCNLRNVNPGFYVLNLQTIDIDSDACPSRPVLFPLNKQFW